MVNKKSKRERIRSFVFNRLSQLKNNASLSCTRALLANMRRGVGKSPGDLPELWGILFDKLPEDMLSFNENEASYEEWAIYIALTLFALHQQGKDMATDFVFSEDMTLGKAIRRLVPSNDDEGSEKIIRKFNIVATSKDIKELQNHLRGIVQLLKTDGIPLNYVDLAYDLYVYQQPEGSKQVRLKWGQDFYRWSSENDETEEIKGEIING